MTDELISQLAQIGSLRVISRTSVMQYKSVRKPLPEIGRELNVDVVVEGTVRRAEGRVRIAAQLMEAATDRHLWVQSYDRDLEDVLTLQSEIALAIAQEIEVSLTREEETRLVRPGSKALESFDAYLLGRHHWNQRSQEGFERAIEYFDEAIREDATFARAYAGLADTYMLMGSYSLRPPKEVQPRAKELARKALELDPALDEAVSALAWIDFTYEWDWSTAEQEFERAIALNPSAGRAHHWYAWYLSAMGRFEDASEEMTRALELDPLSPIIHAQAAQPLYMAGDYDAAIQMTGSALAKFSGQTHVHTVRARMFLGMGAYDQALEDAVSALPLFRDGLAGMAYGFLGRRMEAETALQNLAERSRETYASPTDYALVHIGLGNKDQALDWLERGYEERALLMVFLNTWPLYDTLRDEPRFQDLLRRMNFPD